MHTESKWYRELTIVIPTYNEEGYISDTLHSILRSDIPINSEILIYDGLSTDRTLEIVQGFAEKDGRIKIFKNEKRKQVWALNAAISRATGKVMVRCDAHSIYPTGYFRNFLNYFHDSRNGVRRLGNIGVSYITKNRAENPINLGIADAMRHPMGVGGGHRVPQANDAGTRDVDTVLFGAWPTAIFEEIGLFNVNFERGQDYEHNLRLRKAGYRVVQIPGEPFIYFTRDSFQKLSKMIYQYAYAKGQIIVLHRAPPNIRSLIPALAFIILLSVTLMNFRLGVFMGVVYSLTDIFAGIILLCRRKSMRRAIGFCLALPVMHISHAFGFLRGLIEFATSPGRTKRMDSTR